MTEKQKKVALVIGFAVLAVIILLWTRKGSAATTVVNQEEPPVYNVTIPGFNIPERGGITINIPALPTASQYSYNAISPCMCNGSSVSQPAYSGPLVEFITNQGPQGGNYYNYTNAQQTQSVDNSFVGVYGR